ncbi:MAG: hypothetical protein WBN11_00425 [Eudoraea sp.]
MGEDKFTSEQFTIQLYPNPTKFEVEILIGQQPSDLKEVHLYEMSGRLVQ